MKIRPIKNKGFAEGSVTAPDCSPQNLVMTTIATPTAHQFGAFEGAYDYFNKSLFNSELPPVILNLSRKSKAMGFVAPHRWKAANADLDAPRMHELSLNPEILMMDVIEVFSTLVHEQVHIWQYTYGKPSRNGYHNKQFAKKMVEVGLMPSTTGQEGGKMTGQNMSDYPIEGGSFLLALNLMPEEFKLPFVSIEGYLAEQTTQASTGEGNQVKAKKSSNKTKFTCEGCGANAWGKSSLNLLCGDCGTTLIEVS